MPVPTRWHLSASFDCASNSSISENMVWTRREDKICSFSKLSLTFSLSLSLPLLLSFFLSLLTRERRFEFHFDTPRYFNIVPRHRVLLRRKGISRVNQRTVCPTLLSYILACVPKENALVKHYFSPLNDLSRRNCSLFLGDVDITYMMSHGRHISTLVATPLLDGKVKKCEMTLFTDDIGWEWWDWRRLG